MEIRADKVSRDKYESVISESSEYFEDSAGGDKVNDSNLTSKAGRESTEYDFRNHLYTLLLQDYINNNASKAAANSIYKLMFFLVVLFAFGALTIAPAIVVCEMAQREKIEIADAVLALGSCVSGVSAIIVLPKIIAEYLFPAREDENMIELVKQMQENDSDIRSMDRRESMSNDDCNE